MGTLNLWGICFFVGPIILSFGAFIGYITYGLLKVLLIISKGIGGGE